MTHDDVTGREPPEGRGREADSPAALIAQGRGHLGIELGSTRIKAALIDDAGTVLATGAHDWENEQTDGNWTYSLEAVWDGIQDCYQDLTVATRSRWGVDLTAVGSLGVSAMMHGYLAFDAEDELLVPFRSWRNTYTDEAAALLSRAFEQNIPLRWSVSHLVHAMLEREEHVGRISFLTTLAGYVHWRLTGAKVLGIGDASGMFPIGVGTRTYDQQLLARFDELDVTAQLPSPVVEILPEVRVAGALAGTLTQQGARLLDPAGTLAAGALMAPPEGDAGTGMVATNSIEPRTGNVSAGTSAFAMVVLEDGLSGPRREIDMVTTPSGDPVAMIHTNNCTGDLDAWLGVFARFAALLGHNFDHEALYATLFGAGSAGDADAGGILTYNYLSGEHQTDVPSGRPLLVRKQDARFTLENFMRAQLHGAFGALAVGMDVLLTGEGVQLDTMHAHGGIFRTQGAAQQVLADAIRTPVALGESAGEGGAWGMALLAAFTAQNPAAGSAGTSALNRFLSDRIFAKQRVHTLAPDPDGARGYAEWLAAYRNGLPVERLAGERLA